MTTLRSFLNNNAWAVIVTIFLAGGGWFLLLGKADLSTVQAFEVKNLADHRAITDTIHGLAEEIRTGQGTVLYLLCRDRRNTDDSACASAKAPPSAPHVAR